MSFMQGIEALAKTGQVDHQQLVELNKSLRAATANIMKGSVGYPQQGVGYSGDIAPLVPQSIQNTLDNATFGMDHLTLWNMLPKVNVGSTLHETTVLDEVSDMDIDPFFAEGGKPTRSEALYTRQTVRVKFLAEHIELTDPASMVNVVGPSSSTLAQRTMDGTKALLGKLEYSLFNADSDINDKAFDGLYKQIRTGAPDNYTDGAGSGTSMQALAEIASELTAAPNYGRPNAIFMDPRQIASLSNMLSTQGRFPLTATGTELALGSGKLHVAGQFGNIPIHPAPLAVPVTSGPSATAKGDTVLSAPTVAFANAGASALSKFVTAGSVYYKVVAVAADGSLSAPTTSAAISTAAGTYNTVTITTAASEVYYRVYRSVQGGTAADVKLIGTIKNTGASVVFNDYNDKIPGTAPIYVTTLTPETMQWVQLLDFTRRPLAQVNTTIPFLLMLFGALQVKIPKRQWIIDNVPMQFS